MTSSDSPTHPDAPRAGGETPDIDLEATLRVLRIVEYDLRRRDEAPEPNATSNEIHAEFAETLAALRTALPALLERHRDGERLDWLQRHPMAIPLQHDASGWRTKEATMLREIGPFPSLRDAIDAAQPKETTDAG